MEGGGGGTPLETLKEEGQPGYVLPTSLEANGLKKNSWGFLITGIVGGTLVAVYAVATPFITPALRKICLPFVPATTKQIENVVKMLQSRRGPLVDIGSGDGRIVIAAAKEGFTAVGYELNPWLVWYSRYRAWREGVQHLAKFHISDLWKVTFSQYSNVVIFGVPQMCLLPLLTRVIAHFPCDGVGSVCSGHCTTSSRMKAGLSSRRTSSMAAPSRGQSPHRKYLLNE
ncbi:ATP synthase subunit C lysine N-methyltransferase isoform X1 [Myotis myotis]|uniref:ATP synthase subunit C lysine N-methyltransferase isoform X1 n=1 Tax=Myotis myotis TaxID=51298 RepID=UPI00174AB868|nr:ATP synthase subunit C lysine N-methyltransferase isoform X1 [Myotis myotis]